jgi:hypothetical protein
MGTRYTLELYFQGDNHLDISEALDRSSNNSKPWRMEHPFYGIVFVQPQSFTIDNSALNVSKWSGVVIETIMEDYPRYILERKDSILQDVERAKETFALSLNATPSVTDKNNAKKTLKKNYNLSVKIIRVPEQVELYFNAFTEATSLINTATATPIEWMRKAMQVINQPSLFTLTALQRIQSLTDSFNELRKTVVNITTVSAKEQYQAMGGAHITAIAASASTPLSTEVQTVQNATQQIDLLLASYNGLVADLDTVQTANNGSPDSFVADYYSLAELSYIVSSTIAYLISQALSSRVERIVVVEKDTNVILLTHRFYGLDANDENLNQLIELNEIGLNQILQIKKGTVIKYFTE